MSQFLLDNLNSIVTIFVGTFAFLVFKLQQANAKEIAAKIIWLEILATEKILKEIKVTAITAKTKTILRSSSWFEKRHLIINDFDNDEITLLDEFYSSAETIEQSRKNLVYSMENGMYSKSVAIQNELMSNIMNNIDQPDKMKKNRDDFLNEAGKEGYIFSPDGPIQTVSAELSSVRFVSGSSTATKLKTIAKIK